MNILFSMLHTFWNGALSECNRPTKSLIWIVSLVFSVIDIGHVDCGGIDYGVSVMHPIWHEHFEKLSEFVALGIEADPP